MKDKKQKRFILDIVPPNFPKFLTASKSHFSSSCLSRPFVSLTGVIVPDQLPSAPDRLVHIASSSKLPNSTSFMLLHRWNIFPDRFLHIPDCYGPRQDTNRSTQPITVETSMIASSKVKHRVFGIIFEVKCPPMTVETPREREVLFFILILGIFM